MTEPIPVVETKAQKAERLKREKNPWLAFDEIRAFARNGRSSVLPDWASTYFKWWGVYTQGDGGGVTGGKGGEGLASDFFLLRIGAPNGALTSEQLRVIGKLSRKYAHNFADITVRQSIQLRWLTIESLPEIIQALDAVGLSPKGACGDVVRTVTGCPLAGVAADELIDASPIARDIARLLMGNNEFYNLPRKLKISVTGCPSWCCHPEINDIVFTPARREGKTGFSLRIGGGLSNEPHLARRIDAFVLPHQAVAVARGVAELFREQLGLRQSRERARLKYLFLKEGWTAEQFKNELQKRLVFKLAPSGEEDAPEAALSDHVGVHPQRQPGLSYVGASVLCGRLSGEQLEAAAELAERFGDGSLRTTIAQNLIFLNVPNEQTGKLTQELARIDLRVEAPVFWRGAVSCTGSEFCKLAITETKAFTRWLVEKLDERLPQFDQPLRLHITGCSNGCGQHRIADIGLEGKKVKVDGKMLDAYSFSLGGSLGKQAGFSRPVGYRCAASEAPAAIERLLRRYLSSREADESLRAWLAKRGDEELRAHLDQE